MEGHLKLGLQPRKCYVLRLRFPGLALYSEEPWTPTGMLKEFWRKNFYLFLLHSHSVDFLIIRSRVFKWVLGLLWDSLYSHPYTFFQASWSPTLNIHNSPQLVLIFSPEKICDQYLEFISRSKPKLLKNPNILLIITNVLKAFWNNEFLVRKIAIIRN